MTFPDDVRYTREHEWAREAGGVVTVGITGYATDQLGDVVFVELPEVGKKLESGKTFGVVEAVKTVSDLYAPLAGEVVEVNAALGDDPAIVNREPYGAGWMVKIKLADPASFSTLMSSADYAKLVDEQHA
ncbi:MAG: glycine cleavage system protein GcvH [Candidatus Eisenbacteria bacterium]|nr:glycine cleavage system protein GcvH [Candidatus Eisenbacteria bacterium]